MARDGTSVSAEDKAASRAWSMLPRARAMAMVKQASTTSWVVKALVEATPISGPARVGNTTSASRAIVLSGWFTTTAMCCFCVRA